ncbi:MAG: bifunctional demethylmenaquinone methyltransferase/2-methoxy-6-polyprenyl-1,4-benzoquinol methylase UbiE [Betaproteobacteria bacterium]|jgi:demethylmenaquinone methyltransferase/2-methoxy-6-polyprenyl-1,4-benzoquinol methylase|nr:bifunctional demethylmenaquinone methyltransferase/2-methoxy-6-polyprenyl-1,4-benzoquinol methylase UbiE [Betaproteobacteria bacterium]
MDQHTTHFGFEQVPAGEKAQRVARVFDSVAVRYDLMNDLMSLGLHRAWKAVAISQANIRPGQHVLDVASGTGDLALAFAKRVGPQGRVVMSDINSQMLTRGRNRLIDQGCPVESVVCDAEHLPFPDASFDRVTVAFGLRNMTDKQAALREMARVLKPGGKCLVLEFSKVAAPLEKIYDLYSFKVLPWLGKKIARDEASYRYLAESIRMHPEPKELADMLSQAGFDIVRYHTMSAGVVALHQGVKL